MVKSPFLPLFGADGHSGGRADSALFVSPLLKVGGVKETGERLN